MSNFSIKNFSNLIGVYFLISVIVGIFIPPNVGDLVPALMYLIDEVVYLMPGISNIAQYSNNQEYIKLYYVIQWVVFPIFCFFLFGAMNPGEAASRREKKPPSSLYFYAIFFILLSGMMVYMLGFHYREDVSGATGGGRGGALLYLLSTKYVVAVASPAIFLTIVGLFVASVLIIKNLAGNLKKGEGE